ncbi:zinc finger CCCH domain-containing protein 13-like isoform X3 [Leguminivora glycinivorella]|uniref:zinc finger CCCH domain-containing protein 13-like isoform X3 n=1 Tax=Leguminivora glycinivorella TaxID=1035111 RepID=UPI0020108342|nr:zinc finger CCCH domain-containing protein 13-like isoform X3 [Leguminivora glycinivorella]
MLPKQGQLRVVSAKASLQETLPSKTDAFPSHDERTADSSPSVRSQSSPRRHRRPTRRDNMSLALKAGLASTPRSGSPPREGDATFESVPHDQGSFIYAFLEEAIKRDKKKQRQARRHEERERGGRPRTSSPSEREPRHHRDHREHREHRHHRRRDESPKELDKPTKIENPAPGIDQTALIETFAKLCATLSAKTEKPSKNIQRSLSHKSLQCEGVSKQTCHDVDHRPVKLTNHENSQANIPLSLARSQEDTSARIRSRDNIVSSRSHIVQARDRSSYCVPYDKENTIGEQQRHREQYTSKLDISGSKMHTSADRRHEYAPRAVPTRSVLNQSCRDYREQHPNRDPLRECDYRRDNDREYDRDIELNRDYDRVVEPNRERPYDDDKKRSYNQTSRSYDIRRDCYLEDDRQHRTTRSDNHRDRYCDERRYEDRYRKRCEDLEKRDKYYEDKPIVSRDRNYHMFKESRDRRNKKNLERFERASVTSREEEFKERCSERERDSGLSVADGESTASARSNYLRLVKQEIMEQREAMDKMMNLWKELMRCFKSYSQTSGEKAVTEEINKQRSEMAEMANMWQECLQRYREMSNDFNNLKQKLATPTVAGPALVPPVCADGEGAAAPAAFCQPAYPTPMPTPGYMGGSPVRARASAPAPPPWWWNEAGHARAPPARRSSPESRGSCDRDRHRDRERRRHKERERDDAKYKDKSKPSAARSEHRRRKR